jgi:hypothetical protein
MIRNWRIIQRRKSSEDHHVEEGLTLLSVALESRPGIGGYNLLHMQANCKESFPASTKDYCRGMNCFSTFLFPVAKVLGWRWQADVSYSIAMWRRFRDQGFCCLAHRKQSFLSFWCLLFMENKSRWGKRYVGVFG